MIVSLRKRLLLLMAIVLLLVAVACALLYARSERLLATESIRTLQSQVTQVDVSRQIVNRGSIPTDWSAAAYISEQALNRTLDTLQGTLLGSDKLSGVTFKLVSIDLDVGVGSSLASISIEASQDSTPSLTATVESEALLIFDGMIDAQDATSIASFRISSLRLKPSLKLGSLTAQGTTFANSLISSGAIESVAESLVLRVPLKVKAKLPIKIDEDDEKEVGDTKFVLHLKMPEVDLGRELDLAVPFAFDTGIWLMVNDGAAFQSLEPESLSSDPEALRQSITRGESEIRVKLGKMPVPESDIALWARHDFLAKPLLDFGSLPEANRTVAASISGKTGTLVKETVSVFDSDNAGLTITLEDATGSIVVREVTTRWEAASGLHASVRVDANASARVKSVIGTVVGGGFSMDSTLNGNVSHVADVNLGIRPISVGGEAAIFLGPIFDCKYPMLTVETAGELKLGVETPVAILEKPLKGFPLIDSVPRYQQVKVDPSKGVITIGPSRWIRSNWSELVVETAAGGYFVKANLNSGVHQAPAPPADNGDAQSDQFQDAWKQQTMPTCSTKPSAKVLFAGQDFGPNNEFVKAIALMLKTAGKLVDTYQVSYDRLETVIKDPGKVDDVLKEVGDDIKNEGKRPLKELGRAGKKVEKLFRGIRL